MLKPINVLNDLTPFMSMLKPINVLNVLNVHNAQADQCPQADHGEAARDLSVSPPVFIHFANSSTVAPDPALMATLLIFCSASPRANIQPCNTRRPCRAPASSSHAALGDRHIQKER